MCVADLGMNMCTCRLLSGMNREVVIDSCDRKGSRTCSLSLAAHDFGGIHTGLCMSVVLAHPPFLVSPGHSTVGFTVESLLPHCWVMWFG